MASFRGCKHNVKAVEVGKVRTGRKMCYADTLRKVRGSMESTRPVRAYADNEKTVISWFYGRCSMGS